SVQLGPALRRARVRVCWAREVERDRAYASGVAFEAVEFGVIEELCGRALFRTAPSVDFERGDLRALLELAVESRVCGVLGIESDDRASYVAVREGKIVA